nr:MAG TPA: hypothetical protein [Caudoviricetes sp.]
MCQSTSKSGPAVTLPTGRPLRSSPSTTTAP